MQITSINKNISLKEGKIAVNLDEKINKEILSKLNSILSECDISISDNPKIIYINVQLEDISSNFIEFMNQQINDIDHKLKYEEQQELDSHINMINNFSEKTKLSIE